MDPQAATVEGFTARMPTLDLTAAEVDALIAYIRSLD